MQTECHDTIDMQDPITSNEGRPSGSQALAALVSSALALPGLSPIAHADSATEKSQLNYNFTFYKESDLALEDFKPVGGTSRQRFEIFAHQFRLLTPINARMDVGVDLTFETMSGASPWWVADNGQAVGSGGEFLQRMTGATIEDRRVDGQITLNRFFESGRITGTGGVSSENDYLSGNFGFSFERGYNDRNTTVAAGVGFTWDKIRPTDHLFHGRDAEYDKETVSFNMSLAQVLYRHAMLRVGLSYKNLEGFLSDPYKRVLTVTTLNARGLTDERPTERDQVTISAGYRQFVPGANAALHLEVAGYWDNWDVASLRVELAWYQNITDSIQLVPMVRYYSQGSASFYGPIFYNSEPDLRTSDYRLSAYGAMSAGLRADVNLPDLFGSGIDLGVSVGYQYYASSGGLALFSVPFANPGLVSYHLFNAQLGVGF
jgi:hypothetical protein